MLTPNVLKVLTKLHDSPPKDPTFASITSDTFKLLLANLARLREKLHLLSATLEIHWQASYHINSIQTAQYPWLSSFMASGYWIALAIWLYEYASSLYDWGVTYHHFRESVSVVILIALMHILMGVVPYSLGRGKRFPTLLVLVLLVLLRRVRQAIG